MSYVEHFEFSAAAKKKLFILLAAGVVLFLIGILGLSSGSPLFDPALDAGHGTHANVSSELLADNHDARRHGAVRRCARASGDATDR